MDADVLLLILEHVDVRTLLKAQLTCRLWRRIAAATWKAHCLRDWPGLRTKAQINKRKYPSQSEGPLLDETSSSSGLESWSEYYRQRYRERRKHLLEARCSLVYNLEVDPGSQFQVSPKQDESPFEGDERWKTLLYPSRHANAYFCNIHDSIYSCPDYAEEFILARRFLISMLYQMRLEGCETMKVDRVEPTDHPCLVRVVRNRHPEHAQDGRTSFLCFVETMEIVDVDAEGDVKIWYRRLMDCDHSGKPKDRVRGLDREGFLERLLEKEQTILDQYPHGMSQRLYGDPKRFPLARRYVFRNSKVSFMQGDDEDTPIRPWLNPHSQVANLVAPRIYGSREVCLVLSGFGHQRVPVLCETGQELPEDYASPDETHLDRPTSAMWKVWLRHGCWSLPPEFES
ncbi:uncharacterized protein SPPG_08395 [Spizellomyces punctatus DAOM BR117]|uniref:F-box domain-containing protein n=1 Tax=Spizellomyces punctatus (strain DAOM BR117) TaxID=645134 RepID=A0A0L0H5Q9_SPIPD|nr:uncharacterized protein SPPG_08395 [Spizellomyces punctatus DAOM BR117]KNC96241.1 hypothetical protein SPPG_08395 [Spizellomyces punctatus DAOM BR117]|eukprot:XP_016604281.1 hypothetical protein SPPG_08395 [Spizellomyces punctatus DAOM BR117]